MRRELQLNVISMSNVDIAVKRHYYDPKKSIQDMVYYESWGSREGLDEHMGFYGDILWDSFYAASQSPSYLNRQPYGFLIRGHEIILVSVPDEHTGRVRRAAQPRHSAAAFRRGGRPVGRKRAVAA